jgi:hypothetical protein
MCGCCVWRRIQEERKERHKLKRALREADGLPPEPEPSPAPEPRPQRLGLDFLDMSIPFSKGSGKFVNLVSLQWNLRNQDSFGTSQKSFDSEVSSFQSANCYENSCLEPGEVSLFYRMSFSQSCYSQVSLWNLSYRLSQGCYSQVSL